MGGLRYNLVADIDRYPFGTVHSGSPNRWRLTHIGPLFPRQTVFLGYLARQLIRHRTRGTRCPLSTRCGRSRGIRLDRPRQPPFRFRAAKPLVGKRPLADIQRGPLPAHYGQPARSDGERLAPRLRRPRSRKQSGGGRLFGRFERPLGDRQERLARCILEIALDQFLTELQPWTGRGGRRMNDLGQPLDGHVRGLLPGNGKAVVIRR